jgi:hypothetical protein
MTDPATRAAQLVAQRVAVDARYTEDVRASEELHRARLERAARDRDAALAEIGTAALDMLAQAHRLDERPPRPERAPRRRKVAAAEVAS